jgi:hypothetical protein
MQESWEGERDLKLTKSQSTMEVRGLRERRKKKELG